METMPSWCGQETLPANMGKKLEDDQRIVPISLVEVYAFRVFEVPGDGSTLYFTKCFIK